MATMYDGIVNSPVTTLSAGITIDATTLPLINASVVPAGPNICTIGTGEDAETILYTGKSGSDLTGVTRAFEGIAKAWDAGTVVARNFTNYDYATLKGRIENLDVVNVKDYSVVGDGITNDSAAIQAVIDSSYDKTLYFPPGTYKVSGITFSAAGNIKILGAGRRLSVFKPATASSSIFTIDGNNAISHKEFEHIGFYNSDLLSDVKCFNVANQRGLTIRNIWFKNASSGTDNNFIGVYVDEGQDIVLSEILQEGTVYFEFCATGSTIELPRFIKNLHVLNFNHMGSTNTFAKPWFKFSRVINTYVTNVNTEGLTGLNTAFYLEDDCQGVWFTQVIAPWPKNGFEFVGVTFPGTGTILYPKYTHMVNVAIDQFTESAIKGNTQKLHIDNGIFWGGHGRSNTGPAIDLGQYCDEIRISNSNIGDNDYDGLKIHSAATNIYVVNTRIKENALVSGYDVAMPAGATSLSPRFKNCDIGTTDIPGSLLVNGETKLHYITTTQASTPANTDDTVLATYTLKGGVFKPGQKIRVTAYGTFAANANTKTIRTWWGAYSLGGHVGNFNNTGWKIEAEIFYVSASSQKCIRSAFSNNVAAVGYTATSVNTANDVVIKVSGQNGTANAGDIVLEGMAIEII